MRGRRLPSRLPRTQPVRFAELDEGARERKRTRAEIIREAVEIYLREWADYAISLEPLRDPNRPLWSLRVGDYHVIYAFSDSELWVLVVRPGSRGGVYREL